LLHHPHPDRAETGMRGTDGQDCEIEPPLRLAARQAWVARRAHRARAGLARMLKAGRPMRQWLKTRRHVTRGEFISDVAA
jgi:hypothetical protein